MSVRVVLALGLVTACTLAGASDVKPTDARAAPVGPRAARYLGDADSAIAEASRWRTAEWFDESSPPRTDTPLATVWAVVGLMQAAGDASGVGSRGRRPAKRSTTRAISMGASERRRGGNARAHGRTVARLVVGRSHPRVADRPGNAPHRGGNGKPVRDRCALLVTRRGVHSERRRVHPDLAPELARDVHPELALA